jgi:16S rRNA (cytidine1402-2'-O)-methyltransferase
VVGPAARHPDAASRGSQPAMRVGDPPPGTPTEAAAEGIEARLGALLAGGMSVRQAVACVVGETGAKRREVYARALALKGARAHG